MGWLVLSVVRTPLEYELLMLLSRDYYNGTMYVLLKYTSGDYSVHVLLLVAYKHGRPV